MKCGKVSPYERFRLVHERPQNEGARHCNQQRLLAQHLGRNWKILREDDSALRKINKLGLCGLLTGEPLGIGVSGG